ncbi:MAG: zinc ribbon domain-containing protein [Deltaproteobacteria bacterium]|nr:zinc ribbon domain-containing protein [Deltaproteobacteria bacterium]
MNNIQEVGAEQQSDNKYCTGCGTELVLTNKFCTKCGKKIVFVNKILEIDISSVLSDKIDDVQADTKPAEDNGDQQVEKPLETEEKCLRGKFNYATAAIVVIIAISIGFFVINHYFKPEITSKSSLEPDLKNAYTASQAFFSDSPSKSVTADDLKRWGYTRSKGVVISIINGNSRNLSIKATNLKGDITLFIDSQGNISSEGQNRQQSQIDTANISSAYRESSLPYQMPKTIDFEGEKAIPDDLQSLLKKKGFEGVLRGFSVSLNGDDIPEWFITSPGYGGSRGATYFIYFKSQNRWEEIGEVVNLGRIGPTSTNGFYDIFSEVRNYKEGRGVPFQYDYYIDTWNGSKYIGSQISKSRYSSKNKVPTKVIPNADGPKRVILKPF